LIEKKNEKPKNIFQMIFSKNETPLQAKCMNMDMMTNLKYFAGSEFMLQWIFKNSGDKEWPENVKFVQQSGDEIGSHPLALGKIVKPNETIEIFVNLKAPLAPGKYYAFFRLCHFVKG